MAPADLKHPSCFRHALHNLKEHNAAFTAEQGQLFPAAHARSRNVIIRADQSSSQYYGYEDSDDESPQTTSTSVQQLASNLNTIDDTNMLQTALAAALQAEDYGLAAKVRDRLKQVMGTSTQRIDWGALGLPAWISDRVERLGFRFPSEIQRRSAPVILSGLDAIIQSETGSGKTLSFLVPTLSVLDYPPKIFIDDLQGPQAIIVVPTMELGVQCALTVYKLFGGNLSSRRPGDAANMFTYTGPRGIKLSTKLTFSVEPVASTWDAAARCFTKKFLLMTAKQPWVLLRQPFVVPGPRFEHQLKWDKVRGVLNKEEIAMAKGTDYLKGVHVVVGTPAALVDVYSGVDRQPILDHLKVLVVDEYDECFKAAPEALAMLMSCACKNNAAGDKPQVVLVGATITQEQVQVAAQAQWISGPAHIRVGKENSIPSGLIHRYVVCESGRKLAVLARMLRKDLEELGEDPLQPARAMVFADSAEEAAAATEPLRSALWGEHTMAVLLPPGTRIPPPPGSEAEETALSQDGMEAQAAVMHELADASPFSALDPVRAMHSFRDNRTSLLLCTPQAARGLDLPAVSHVYNLGFPQDSTQYLHRAGRAGRIGSTTGGIVTTLVSPEELEHFKQLSDTLDIQLQEVPAPGSVVTEVSPEQLEGANVEKLRKGLEDLFNLM